MQAQLSSIPILKTTETSISFIYERADGIFHVEFKKGAIIDIAQQEENRLKYIELTAGVKIPFLYTSNGGLFITKEARENARRTEPNTPILARAAIANSFVDRIIVEFYQKFYRPYIPVKVFTDLQEGVNWLYDMKAQHAD